MIRYVVATFKYILITTVIFMFIAVVYNQLYRKEDNIFSSEVGKQKGLVSKMYRTVITEKNPNDEVLKLSAMESFVGDTFMEMKKIDALFSPANNRPLDLTANNGLLDNNSGNAVFTGNVRVVSKRPFLLITERLDWVDDERLLKTTKRVRMESDEGVVTGLGLLLNVDTQDVIIVNSVKANMKKRIITGDRGEFLNKEKRMKVIGNAKMVQSEADLGEAGVETVNIDADELEAWSESEGADYETVTAKGNVRIVTEKREITGDLTRLYTPEHKIVVTGNAILKEETDDLMGEKIIYFYDRDDIIISGGEENRARMILAPPKDD
jgi:LPS export ABC transporter protein LptC/lipopolysaccharide transport protein LptA